MGSGFIGVRLGRTRLAIAALVVLLSAAVVVPAAQAAETAPAPRWELLVNHGPTNIPRLAPEPEEFEIALAGHIGRWTAKFETEKGAHAKTEPMAPDATAREVQEKLEKIKLIGAGNVEVSGGPEGSFPTEWTYKVKFVGSLLGLNPALEIEKKEPTNEETHNAEAEEVSATAEGKVFPPGYFLETDEAFEEGELEATHVGTRNLVEYVLIPNNRGGAPTSGTTTITDTLPAHTEALTAEGTNGAWTCKIKTGAKEVECTSTTVAQADSVGAPIDITAYANPSTLADGENLVDTARISGGGSPEETVKDSALVSETAAPFGVHDFKAGAYGAAGEQYTVAGGHPYSATTTFFMNTINFETPEQTGGVREVESHGNLKDANVMLPEGFIGNAATHPRCTQAQFASYLRGGPKETHCPAATQVGIATLFVRNFADPGESPVQTAIYNLETPKGKIGTPAEFGFLYNEQQAIRFDAHVKKINGKYQVTVLSANTNEGENINGVSITLWGTPADPSHTPWRFKEHPAEAGKSQTGEESNESPVRPFLTNPSDCLASAEQAPTTKLFYDSWENPVPTEENGEPKLSALATAEVAEPAVTGCENLSFKPEVQFRQRPAEEGGSQKAAAPSGYEFELKLPQHEEKGELVTPPLKDTKVTLPAGVVLSPSAANGLEGCTPEQFSIESTSPGNCPSGSRVGEVTINSALLTEPVKGSVFIGTPECNPCNAADDREGKIFKLYIEAEAPNAGINIKLAGKTIAGTLETEAEEGGLKVGQLETTFLNNPQFPFSTLKLDLKGGPRATLANPQTCGTFTSDATLTAWSEAGSIAGKGAVPGTAPVTDEPTFPISWDGEGGACPATLPFSPSLSAGTTNPAAGQYSPLTTIVARPDDREQTLRQITVKMPAGLLGKVSGVTKCESTVPLLESGTETCPANSRIATATTEAGVGSEPYAVSGPVYLAGPTKLKNGAEGPFGLDIVVPAKAGPFNLGTVVVQAAIEVNEETGALTIVSEPLPQSRDGVPFRIKAVEVKVDRPEFTFNATHCENTGNIEASVGGEPVTGSETGGSVTDSEPYGPTGCAALPFSPTFEGTVNARTQNEPLNGVRFSVRINERPGEANVHKFELELPADLPSRQENFKYACTQAEFEAAKEGADCPANAFVGTAVAHTPVLNVPLEGRAVLEARGAKFPDLVFLLHGEGVRIQLRGHTTIKEGRTFSKFETVPDAPISSFESTFPAGRYSLLGVGEQSLCRIPVVGPTKITGQNNKVTERFTQMKVEGCPPNVKAVLAGVSRGYVRVLVRTNERGRVTIRGRSIRTRRVTLSPGTHQVAVRLNGTGLRIVRRGGELQISVSQSAGGQTGSTTVKAGV